MIDKGYTDVAIYSEQILEYEDRVIDKKYLYNNVLDTSKTMYNVNYTDVDFKYKQDDFIYEIE